MSTGLEETLRGPLPVTKSRDTSNFLMTIVRTLSSSSDFDKRENEKTRIEKAFQESDKTLSEMVSDNYSELTKILQTFSIVNKNVNESRDKIRKIKEDLSSCKTLLHCKRDELRRLWIEGVEHKTIVSILDQIEQIKDVPEKLEGYMAKKHYLHATELVVSAVARVEGSLSGVNALRDLKVDLIARKEQMHEVLIDELNRQIYIRATSEVSKNVQKPGSGRSSKQAPQTNSPADRNYRRPGGMARTLLKDVSGSPSSSPTLSVTGGEKNGEIAEDLNSDPEENLSHFIAILVESLFLLKKLPEAVEAVKMRIQPELMAIVSRASEKIVESSCHKGDSLANEHQPRYLLQLLQLVFQQFRCVANAHQIILNNLQRIVASGAPVRSDQLLYDMVDIWSKIQAVLQLLLSDYLDIQNSASSRQNAPSNFDEPNTDIGMYFSKKKPTKPKKLPLFRFDASIHALSTNSYIEDHRPTELIGGTDGLMENAKHQFVCKPGAHNITAIFTTLENFIKEIETAMACAPGSSSLQAFVTEFVKNIFLYQVHYNVSSSISSATKGFDALRNVIDHKTLKELAVPRPLLQSTVTVDRNIQELQALMHDLPDYAEQFLNMICKILEEYRDTCHSAYRGIVQYDSDEKRIISAMWAKDEDISRFLRSLPSWRSLQPTAGQELNLIACSEEEMRALNLKEAMILISNLSTADSLIPQQEIITDVTQMRTVANVHESLEWFAHCRTPSTQTNNDPNIPPVSEKTLSSLKSLVTDFQNLAEICLLLLHLEVRVHCFYYLLPVAKQSNYAGPIDDLDPDSNVLKLNKDLSNIEEVLSLSLQPKKFKYIFESLGYLVASILINSIQFLKKINENGIKKMCRNIFAIQQNLTNITMSRESDLDHARQYYELLYTSPDAIIDGIAEKGAQYTEQEYIQLFQLQHRSQPGIHQAEWNYEFKEAWKLEELITADVAFEQL
ncbi:exocyst complex component 4 isoform X2 [Octopus vulgaris]|uniref:Exocyst complex component Sec8 n=1 Tax=Octopus vulgaris TaxID=6645 RepID=A0AA36BEW0_OCTVU|nr:exocyst complex component 4 isoform X2 [Octopus vulgaris]